MKRPGGAGARVARVVIALASRIVENRLRAEWRREWEAELWVATQRGRPVLRDALGAFHHALAVRRYATHDRYMGPSRVGEMVIEGTGHAGRRTVRMINVVRDIHHAARRLTQSRGFTSATLLTLMIGIGGTTAVFSLIDGILLRPLPYPAADELVRVYSASPERDIDRNSLSLPDFEDWHARATSFANLAAYFSFTRNLTGVDDPTPLRASYVSADFFATLGVGADHGRTLSAEEVAGAVRVVVLSERVWKSQFGSDRSAVGASVSIDGLPHVVVGVMPAHFRFPDPETDLWIPLSVLLASDLVPLNRSARWLDVVGRLRSTGMTEHAQAQLTQIAGRLSDEEPASNAGWNEARVVPLQQTIIGDVGPALHAAFAAVGLVLLLVCSNVAILTLARATARDHEISLRAALGASRSRLARELVTESLLLAALGGIGGVILAHLSMTSIQAVTAPLLPRIEDVRIDARVLGFALAVTAFTMLLIGVLPMLRARRLDLYAMLGARGRSSVGVRPGRIRWGLVAAQVALAVTLTTAAGLMLKSLLRLQSVDPGFTSDGVLAASIKIPVPPNRAELSERIRQSTEQMLEKLRVLPGVQAVGSISALPCRTMVGSCRFRADERKRPVQPMPWHNRAP